MLLLRLLEANLDGTELTYDQLELAELVQRGLTKETCRKAAEAVLERCRAANAEGTPIDLKPVTNSSAFSVRDTVSILRAYDIFRTMGCRYMVVTDVANRVVGCLSRNDLVDVCHPHDDSHGAHNHGTAGAAAAHPPAHVVSPAAGPAGNREALLPEAQRAN